MKNHKNGNLDEEKIGLFFTHCSESKAYDNYLYDIFSDINDCDCLLPKELFRNKDNYEAVITDLFDMIIISGFRYYQTISRGDASLNETNFLKNDQNYYEILKADWFEIKNKINAIYQDIK